jgi:hypothetical protein
LILVGAFLFLWGAASGDAIPYWMGLALIAVGIALEAAVLAWSAGLTRRAAARAAHPGAGTELPFAARRRCPRCGWTGPRGPLVCPRCSSFLV